MSGAAAVLSAARRRLVVDSLGIWAIAIIVGGIFGFTARQGGLSLIEAIAFSSILFAGAAQFAAVGLLVVNTPWPSIVLLVWLLNARHLLYSASVAPYTTKLSLKLRAGLAYLLTDEAFALTTAHIARLGRIDVKGAWYAAYDLHSVECVDNRRMARRCSAPRPSNHRSRCGLPCGDGWARHRPRKRSRGACCASGWL